MTETILSKPESKRSIPISSSSSSLMHFFNKCFTIVQISVTNNFIYRYSFFLNSLLLVSVILVQYLFWKASFGQNTVVEDYTFTHLFSYLISVNLIYKLTTPDDVMFSDEIREGRLNTQLLKPIPILRYHFLKLIGHKLAYFISTLVPLGLFIFLLSNFGLISLQIQALNIIAVVLFMTLGLVVHYQIEASIGLLAFWYERSDFLLILKEIIFWLVAGLWIPYNLMPKIVNQIFTFLPFRFLAYVPAQILASGEVNYLKEAIIGLSWAIGLTFLSQRLLKMGLKKYQGYGG